MSRTPKKLVFALALCAVAASAFAQSASAPTARSENPRLQFSAEASRETALDEMTVFLATEAEGSDPGALNQTVLSRANEALAQAKKSGVVTARLVGVTTNQVYGPRGTPSGWKVRAQIAIKGSDLPKVGAMAGTLSTRLQVSGVQFSLSPAARATLERQLTEEAATALLQKASFTAKALGYQSFALEDVTLQDQSLNNPMPVNFSRRGNMEMMAMAADAAPMPTEAGTTTVTVRFSASARLLGMAATR